MADPFVTVERRPDGVALIRLDRPKANALSGAVLGQIFAAATELREEPPGAVVLWGGRRIFAAGADIVELNGDGAGVVGASFAAALGALASVPRATVAAING
jgi:enoyl-CoA hydratase/carnithine racemase